MIPTPRLWALLALGTPLAAIAAWAGFGWMAIVFDLALLAVAIGTYYMAPSGSSLKVVRTFDPVLSVRVPNRIELRLLNDGLEKISCRVRDEPPPDFESSREEFQVALEPGQEKNVQYTVTPPERGGDFFRGTFVRIRCPLGLIEKEARLRTEQ